MAVEESMKRVAVDVRGEVVPECGHFNSEEAPDLIAGKLPAFFGEENG
jgi:pimeloyl-ACP methyl ester carboxylesterase